MGAGASAAAFEKFEDGVPVAVGGDGSKSGKGGDSFQPVSSETSTETVHLQFAKGSGCDAVIDHEDFPAMEGAKSWFCICAHKPSESTWNNAVDTSFCDQHVACPKGKGLHGHTDKNGGLCKDCAVLSYSNA